VPNTYRVALSVTVPAVLAGLATWVPAPEFEDVIFRELITSAADVEAVVKMVGASIARALSGRPGFRLIARGNTTGWLVGMGEWRAYAPGSPLEPAYLWAADWSTLPPFPASAAVSLTVA
jgi:hypothetical protein